MIHIVSPLLNGLLPQAFLLVQCKCFCTLVMQLVTSKLTRNFRHLHVLLVIVCTTCKPLQSLISNH